LGKDRIFLPSPMVARNKCGLKSRVVLDKVTGVIIDAITLAQLGL
jgi:hypothetical protein